MSKGRTRSRASEAVARQRRQTRFLKAFAEHATVSSGAAVVGIGRRTHYDWLEKDEAYAARFADADADVTEALEAEARRRAQVGVEEPVYYQGKVVGQTRRFSDLLLIFLLKARRPEVYRERVDHTHGKPGGGPVVVSWLTDADADAEA